MMVALPSAQRALGAWSPERELGANEEAGGPGSEDRGMQVAECALSVRLGPWSRRGSTTGRQRGGRDPA